MWTCTANPRPYTTNGYMVLSSLMSFRHRSSWWLLQQLQTTLFKWRSVNCKMVWISSSPQAYIKMHEPYESQSSSLVFSIFSFYTKVPNFPTMLPCTHTIKSRTLIIPCLCLTASLTAAMTQWASHPPRATAMLTKLQSHQLSDSRSCWRCLWLVSVVIPR